MSACGSGLQMSEWRSSSLWGFLGAASAVNEGTSNGLFASGAQFRP